MQIISVTCTYLKSLTSLKYNVYAANMYTSVVSLGNQCMGRCEVGTFSKVILKVITICWFFHVSIEINRMAYKVSQM